MVASLPALRTVAGKHLSRAALRRGPRRSPLTTCRQCLLQSRSHLPTPSYRTVYTSTASESGIPQPRNIFQPLDTFPRQHIRAFTRHDGADAHCSTPLTRPCRAWMSL